MTSRLPFPSTAVTRPRFTASARTGCRQTGLTLIELMVALFLGLLIVGMALGTILMSRNLAATTTDVSALQQQAAYAFRILGTHIRQAGSPELDLGLQSDPLDQVELVYRYDGIHQVLSGTDDPASADYLKTARSNYEESVFDPAAVQNMGSGHLLRDCLGQEAIGEPLLRSSFRWAPASGNDATGRLLCQGTGNTSQELIRNVSDFRVHYLQQSGAAGNHPEIQRVDAPDADDALGWSRIVAVEICLDMVGDERIDVPATETYKDCTGNDVSYENRTHMVFKNVFQIRSQGIALDRG